MLVRLSKNSFVRIRHGRGYIYNQITKWDRYYNETGREFLLSLSRDFQQIDKILSEKIFPNYSEEDHEIIRKDFLEFLLDLKENRFIVMGDTVNELEESDKSFSYSDGNLKFEVPDYRKSTSNKVMDPNEFINSDKPQIQGIQFEMTVKCNERCVHCYIPNPSKDTEVKLSPDKIKDVIDEFCKMGGLEVTLSGGESLLYPDFWEILDYCRQNDLVICILSNLTTLTDKHIQKIKVANVSLVQVSLYSMIPEHHDAITQVKGSFDRTKRAIEKLVAADIPVQISCPVMKENSRDYKDVLNFAQSLNVKAQTDFIMMAQSNLDHRNLAHRITLEDTEVLLRDIFENDIDYKSIGTKEYASQIKDARDEANFLDMPLCNAGVENINVLSNGDVIACSGWNGMVAGNIYENSLSEIWNNSDVLNKIRHIRQKDFPKCLECEYFIYCSRCYVRNFNESNGDMFALPEYFCEVAKLNRKIAEEYMHKAND